MADQPDLFDVGERLHIQQPTLNKSRQGPCTPAMPGTGPQGETCGSCRYKATQGGVAGRYIKCELMATVWTRGGGTDIKARWPACAKWEAKL